MRRTPAPACGQHARKSATTPARSASTPRSLLAPSAPTGGIENRDHYVRDVTMGEDDSRNRQRPGGMARIRSAALNILRVNGIQNVSQTLYANALSLDRLFMLGNS